MTYNLNEINLNEINLYEEYSNKINNLLNKEQKHNAKIKQLKKEWN